MVLLGASLPGVSWRYLMSRIPNKVYLVIFLSLVAACGRKEIAKAPAAPAEEIPHLAQVDQAIIEEIFGVGRQIANTPLGADISPLAGQEFLVALKKNNRDYSVTVIGANRRALSEIPLGGKMLIHANITWVGDFRAFDFFDDSGQVFLMPVETEVYNSAVCGFIAFRYLEMGLAMMAEFSAKCWRKEAGGKGGEPWDLIKVNRQGKALTVETIQEKSIRPYRWIEEQAAFVEQVPKPLPQAKHKSVSKSSSRRKHLRAKRK